MDKYRRLKDAAKHGQDRRHKLLLPLSFGVSSTVLLHLLDAQIEWQLCNSHFGPGFDLHVLVIDPSTIQPLSPSSSQSLGLAQQRFPTHAITQLSLHDIFAYDPKIEETLRQFVGADFVDDLSLAPQQRLNGFRVAPATATARADLDGILLCRLVVAFAVKTGCDAVVWGDSDNRLAAKTLANVAKGRGSALNWQVSDGMSPWGVDFSFPLRDLFKAELDAYANLFPGVKDMLLSDAPVPANGLTKNLSIDELMMRYVETQGEKYPGVMANVARTISKLQPPSAMPATLFCQLCGAPNGSPAQSPGNDNELESTKHEQFSGFCYACKRSQLESKKLIIKTREQTGDI